MTTLTRHAAERMAQRRVTEDRIAEALADPHACEHYDPIRHTVLWDSPSANLRLVFSHDMRLKTLFKLRKKQARRWRERGKE